MSAINVIQMPAEIHVLTDGAVCDPAGNLAYCTGKVWPMPHLNLVMAFRGSLQHVPFVFADLASTFSGFDDLKNHISAALAANFASIANFDLVVAGWSECVGPCSYFICNHDRHPGTEAFQITDLAGLSLLPACPAMLTEFGVAFPPGTNPHHLDPMRDGLRILEMQRRHFAPWPDGTADYHSIGGFAQLTTVRQTSIETRIIHRWPDQVGSRILPAAG